MEYYSVPKINELSSNKKTWKKKMHIAKYKMPIYILYGSNYMIFWKKETKEIVKKKKSVVGRGWGQRERRL